MKKNTESKSLRSENLPQYSGSLWRKLQSPGLRYASRDIKRLGEQLSKKWAVFSYKKSGEFAWVVFIGGTGTGKSTIFNALCNMPLSETGVERPKTFGPLVYAHQTTPIEKGFPFSSMEIERSFPDGHRFSPYAGSAGRLMVLEHLRKDLSHLALVDTPDLDSLEARNREMVEDLYLLADVVVFVTSQEKYADDVPFQFLDRIYKEGKPYFLLFNKADNRMTREEALASMSSRNLNIPEKRFWMLPFLASHPAGWLPEDSRFRDFAAAFSEVVSEDEAHRLLEAERRRMAGEIAAEMRQLVEHLEEEQRESQKWLEHLDQLFKSSCLRLFDGQEKELSGESREYIQNEIRKHFGKYDLLGKPRRFISQIILAPLKALGLTSGRSQETHAEALQRIRNKIDLAPIQAAVESFNRSALEQLSPQNEASLLYKKLRDPSTTLTGVEIKEQVWAEQDKLANWLETTFRQLSQGISKSKEMGIYSTSILWGGLILSLEAAIGGGISIIEAVLDSAIAPFVTRGAVEVFVYHELQKIARELALRYRSGILSVMSRQRDRYVECLNSTMTPGDALDALKLLQRSAESHH